MAFKRDFGTERQSAERKAKTGARNQPMPAGETPENVDNLVSSFLAELTDLSSEMNLAKDQGTAEEEAGDSGAKQAAGNVRMPPQFKLQEEVRSDPDDDLDGIDDEIENSLVRLENLRSAADPKRGAAPAIQQASNEAPDESLSEMPAQPEDTPASKAGDIPWSRPEIFGSGVSSPEAAPRRPSGIWILAGAVLAAVLGISAFYFFRPAEATPDASTRVPASEPKAPDPAPEAAAGLSAPQELAPVPADLKRAGGAPVQISAQIQKPDRSKAVSRSAPQMAEAGSGRTGPAESGFGAARPETSRSEKVSDLAPAVERTGTGDAVSIPAVQSAAVTAPPEQVLPATTAAPPVTVPEPKPEPVVQAAAAKDPPVADVLGGRQTAPANPAPKVSSAPPKPTPPANTGEAGPAEATAPPRKAVPVMAEIITRVPPQYPALARSRKVSGTVQVEAEINRNGDVVRAKAVSGPILLRGAAEEALMKWKFRPASVNGVSVPSTARISVSFNLQ